MNECLDCGLLYEKIHDRYECVERLKRQRDVALEQVRISVHFRNKLESQLDAMRIECNELKKCLKFSEVASQRHYLAASAALAKLARVKRIMGGRRERGKL